MAAGAEIGSPGTAAREGVSPTATVPLGKHPTPPVHNNCFVGGDGDSSIGGTLPGRLARAMYARWPAPTVVADHMRRFGSNVGTGGLLSVCVRRNTVLNNI